VRTAAALGGIGAALGGVLAVLLHYLTHRQRLRSGYYPLDDLDGGKFLVHPNWWPLTALCLVGGLGCGLLVALGRWIRRRRLAAVSR
jgi:hypothetical protein